MMESDHQYMARALQLARRGWYTAHPNPRVGCVLVQDGQIVGEGWHQRTGGPHAEIAALTEAGGRARGGTAYVTLEPCSHHGRTPPCTDALIAAGIRRVVTGSGDPNPKVDGAGLLGLAAAGIEIRQGVLEGQCRALNAGFYQRMRTGMPRVTVKIATSLDGRTALANGASKWISGEAARLDVQRRRAASGAIMTGIGTVLADDPSLNVRVAGFEALQPMRVVLDSALRLPVSSRMLGLPGRTLVFTGTGDNVDTAALVRAGATVERLPLAGLRVDLAGALRRLAELEINDVLVEAGPELNGALLAAGLIDELVIYQAAHVLGASARGMFDIPLIEDMGKRPGFVLRDLRQVGSDIRMIYYPAARESD